MHNGRKVSDFYEEVGATPIRRNGPRQCGDDERILLNVGGVRHETHVATLRNIPCTRLCKLAELHVISDSKRDEYFFDRHPSVFNSVIDFYRTGKSVYFTPSHFIVFSSLYFNSLSNFRLWGKSKYTHIDMSTFILSIFTFLFIIVLSAKHDIHVHQTSVCGMSDCDSVWWWSRGLYNNAAECLVRCLSYIKFSFN